MDSSLILPILQISYAYLVEIAVGALAWYFSFRFAQARHSDGLKMISSGFLVKTLVDAAWFFYYWVLLGGPFQVSDLFRQGRSVSQVGVILGFENMIGTGLSMASWIIAVVLIISGALKLTEASKISVPTASYS